VRNLINPPRWAIIEVLIGIYPESVAKVDLADAAGTRATSSGYRANLSALRSMGLIAYVDGQVVAQPVLFLEV
jgi:hypothetical protein